MRKIITAAIALASLTLLVACNPITIPNPFGGPPLILTGNLQNDLPGMKAYAADIRAGVRKDTQEVRDFFIAHCDTVYAVDAQAKALTTTQVQESINSTSLLQITNSGAEKQLGNVQKGTSLAKQICDGGTATDVKTAFVNFVSAAQQIYAWVHPLQPKS